ncbi:MAG: hypothetical protein SPI30_08280 [Prevotella sp.]|nr:hypothetical protein [Prevotella sp.]
MSVPSTGSNRTNGWYCDYQSLVRLAYDIKDEALRWLKSSLSCFSQPQSLMKTVLILFR